MAVRQDATLAGDGYPAPLRIGQEGKNHEPPLGLRHHRTLRHTGKLLLGPGTRNRAPCLCRHPRSSIHREVIRTRDAPHLLRLHPCAFVPCIDLGFFNLVSLVLI